MPRRFRLVDVFGERPLTGNQLAVVVDSEGLESGEMLELTRWIGFSETTFLLPPETSDADYKVRIFTLAGELPFAGHPTLGTCHVWQALHAHQGGEIVQECGAGLVRLRRDVGRISFRAPPLLRDGDVDEADLDGVASVLGVDRSDIVSSQWVDNGPGWVGVLLADAEAVLDLEPDLGRRRDGLDIGVVGFHPEGAETAYEVRAFFSDQSGRMLEDPVTGSLNASLAQWLIATRRIDAPYVASQGSRVGRSGRVHVSTDVDGSVWVGGNVFDIVDGVW